MDTKRVPYAFQLVQGAYLILSMGMTEEALVSLRNAINTALENKKNNPELLGVVSLEVEGLSAPNSKLAGGGGGQTAYDLLKGSQPGEE